eukprot:3940973-Rhodomonas_salina.8
MSRTLFCVLAAWHRHRAPRATPAAATLRLRLTGGRLGRAGRQVPGVARPSTQVAPAGEVRARLLQPPSGRYFPTPHAGLQQNLSHASDASDGPASAFKVVMMCAGGALD